MFKFDTKSFLFFGGGLFFIISSVAVIGAIILWIIGMNGSFNQQQKTITVSGTGEVFTTPDIAELSFSVSAEKKNVADAQKEVTETMNALVKDLGKIGINDSDIKTVNYMSYPRYEYELDTACAGKVNCGQKRVLVGYELSHNIVVKIRDLTTVGAVVQALGSAKVDSLNGPNFRVENMDEFEKEASALAIREAKQKAEDLARELGVRLGRVLAFNEGYSGGPVYMQEMASYDMAVTSMSNKVSAPTPILPQGEDRIERTVNVTYKLK